ncbi:MAG TPA: hypothetical protein VNN08_24090 [Thermoanaerobaculia bacterium]|nr:hypothetical protein [Thermoanaerobaculia bacterium]
MGERRRLERLARWRLAADTSNDVIRRLAPVIITKHRALPH